MTGYEFRRTRRRLTRLHRERRMGRETDHAGREAALVLAGGARVLVLAIALLKDILLPFVAAVVIAYFLNPIADRLQALRPQPCPGRPSSSSAWSRCSSRWLWCCWCRCSSIRSASWRRRCLAKCERGRQSVEEAGRAAGSDPNFPAFQGALDRLNNELAQNWTALAGTVMASIWSRRPGAGQLCVAAADHAGRRFLPAGRLAPDAGAYRRARCRAITRRPSAGLAGEINDAVAAFIRGQGAICLMLGIFYAIGLSWAGIDYGLLVGLTTGLLAFIPIVGWLLGLILCGRARHRAVLARADAAGQGRRACWSRGIAIDTAFLSPRFVGQKIGLHPVWLIFALFVFSYLFGLVGTLVAVPLAAAIGVLVALRCAISTSSSSVYKGASTAQGEALSSGGDTP